jgi:hypothetical protein
MKKIAIGVLPLLLLAAGPSCRKAEPPPPTPAPVTLPPTTAPAPLNVTAVTLGTAIGADKRVTAPLDVFRPGDTIYASVDAAGMGRSKLRALWTFVRGDRTAKVDETTIDLDATGPAVTEFHVSKPGGWPKGDYRVDVYLGDAATPAMTKTFKVA